LYLLKRSSKKLIEGERGDKNYKKIALFFKVWLAISLFFYLILSLFLNAGLIFLLYVFAILFTLMHELF